MATEEHKHLANIIKNTHMLLREESQNDGPEISWQRHILRKDILLEYATSMHKLATTHWMEHNLNANSETHCRIQWIKNQSKEYFLNGGLDKYDQRELNIKTKVTAAKEKRDNINPEFTGLNENMNKMTSKAKIKLLDVGSCYNPFGMENIFDATAIDLTPMPDKVLECDFLNVDTGKEMILSDDMQQVLQLPENHFDMVVFSLFLEYLPCPHQRYICCKKASKLLKNRGILFIISPDSKHVGANANLIKSWRYVHCKLGFMRIKYEKLRHIHCLIFRKCVFKEVALRWADLQTFPKDDPLYMSETNIFIPQDFQNSHGKNKDEKKDKKDVYDVLDTFHELPFAIT